jgi:hypothetical protein
LVRTGESFGDRERYERSFGRYSVVDGNERIGFLRARLVKRADGFVDVDFPFNGAIKDRATSDPAEISAACPSS